MLLAAALFICQSTTVESFSLNLQNSAPAAGDEDSRASMALTEILKENDSLKFDYSAVVAHRDARADVPAGESTVSPKATFLSTRERFHADLKSETKIGDTNVTGLLDGLRGFEHFYNPVGQPVYFETPFNESGLRPLFMHHLVPTTSQIGGGHIDVLAVQARFAITERLGFIATKDGRSWVRVGAMPDADGWNDIAIGLKYVAIADRENDFVLTPGIRWMWSNGTRKILQGQRQEFSPFVSAAKGFDKLHLIGNITLRTPDTGSGNEVIQWDAHADYEIAPQSLPGVAPIVELHGIHYLTDGDTIPLNASGIDYTNLGSSRVAGSSVVWIEFGARAKFSPNFSIGAVYGWALTNREGDIFDERFTVDFEIKW
ncbi:MAG: hypothetical protein HY286_19480 [Planctomycetes bacterium]|nr:hypothetical protein [Planctomycetota bacterium]